MQICSTQPLLVLASCMRPASEVPPDLLSFFNTQAGAATSVFTKTSADHFYSSLPQLVTCEGGQAHDNGNAQHSSSGSSVIEMGTVMHSSSAWQEAVGRCASAAAHAVAMAAAQQLQQKLFQQLQADAHADKVTQTSSGAVSFAEGAGLGVQGQDIKALGVGSHDTMQAQQPMRESRALQLNANDLQKGLQLHAEVRCLCPQLYHLCMKLLPLFPALQVVVNSAVEITSMLLMAFTLSS